VIIYKIYYLNDYLLTGVVFDVSLQIDSALTGPENSSELGFCP
jgi:hypothetical protein